MSTTDGFVPLLACGIPDLGFDCASIFELDIFGRELHPYGGDCVFGQLFLNILCQKTSFSNIHIPYQNNFREVIDAILHFIFEYL